MRAAVKVSVDRQLCIGSGMCVLTAPDVFDQDDDGKSLVRNTSPSLGHSGIRTAEQVCPAAAILITGTTD